METKNNTNVMLIVAVAVLAIILAFFLFDFRLNDKGALPTVKADVDVQGGRLPSAEIRGPEVHVGTKEAAVAVPKVEVKKEEVNVPVPTVSVKLPEDTKGAEASK